jgi:hypothetical protein
MIILTFLLAVASAPALADDYRIGHDKIGMHLTRPEGYEVSSKCTAATRSPTACLALRAAAKASARRRLGHLESGGRNPGSLICRDLGGTVAVGVDSNGDEEAFCLFEADQSFISVDSLVIAGKKNDGT